MIVDGHLARMVQINNACRSLDMGRRHEILGVDEIYLKKNQLFALKYTLEHSLIKNKLISTPTCFGPIRPSSGSCRG